ncbi:unnamed protein product [Lepeophtheirus salmonis]|uniref:(salmon louse) hypothetical protein n=1 Tax=Lepeophtheirus salmonis TaxID=72036 RepID=A0A7R8CQG7_LEPSM|nr:unnamed protein product [Lepeophtheirus salmonis]CAF2847202.1 unnamed protein product [Lepeophtheirus salmonis]
MSKSRGNVLNPSQVIDEHFDGFAEALRFALLHEGILEHNSNYSRSKMLEIANVKLGNVWGNLLSRVTAPTLNKSQTFPMYDNFDEIEHIRNSEELITGLEDIGSHVTKDFDNYHFSKGIRRVMDILRTTNAFIDEARPWSLAKDAEHTQMLSQNGNGMSVLKIESLEYSQSPLNIVLKLVCSDLKTYAKLTRDSNENKMSEILDEILHGIKFLPGYLINLKHHLIGELYGISGATKYTVSSIITKERFDHIEESKKLLPTNIGGMTSQIYELSRVFHGTLGINRRRGILLCGPSGSGKTTCFKTAYNINVSRNANAFLINVSANEFFGSREGESEGIIRSIFDQAKLNATEGLTVIYIQNIELLNGTTTDKNPKSSMGRNLLQFTHILDDLAKNPNNNLVVVASTQNVVNVHQSLRRPGRLDSEIHFGVPKFSQRLEMINYLMPSLKEAEWLSEMTLGYLPADLELLISHAKMEALHRNAPYLGKEDLSTALK